MLKLQKGELIKLVTRSKKVFGRLSVVGSDSCSTFDQEEDTLEYVPWKDYQSK